MPMGKKKGCPSGEKSLWSFGRFKRLYSTAARCATIIFAPLTLAPWRKAKKTVRGFFSVDSDEHRPYELPECCLLLNASVQIWDSGSLFKTPAVVWRIAARAWPPWWPAPGPRSSSVASFSWSFLVHTLWLNTPRTSASVKAAPLLRDVLLRSGAMHFDEASPCSSLSFMLMRMKVGVRRIHLRSPSACSMCNLRTGRCTATLVYHAALAALPCMSLAILRAARYCATVLLTSFPFI